ncbi:MAG TPA: lysozyme [Rhizomicrobium sp.]|nr:lysozyme [Rhizomicrobium sp.]
MSNWPGDAAVFPICLPIIKQFEGFRAAPYLDSVGVATVGYGTTHYPDGSAVTLQDPPITGAEANSYLTAYVARESTAITPLLQRMPTLNQAAAMLSLAYNIGTPHYTASSVLRDFNAGNFPAAADAFLLWDKGTVNGQLVVIPGLHARRVAERTIFLATDS